MVLKISSKISSRKGLVFSMISLLISILFIILFMRSEAPSIDSNVVASTGRVTSMNNFITSFDSFIKDAAVLATVSALSNITEQISEGVVDPAYLSDPSSVIVDCVVKGRSQLNSSEKGIDVPCSGAYNLSYLVGGFVNAANESLNLKVSIDFNDDSFYVKEYLPFYLMLYFQVNYTVIDPYFAFWNRRKVFKVLVPIAGLKDPLFAWHSPDNGVDYFSSANDYSRTIIEQSSTEVSGLTPDEFESMVLNNTYYPANNAPTYFERLSDLTFSSACSGCGIVSFIKPSIVDFDKYSLDPHNVSFTDYQFFKKQAFNCDSDIIGLDDNAFTSSSFPKGLQFDAYTTIYFINDSDYYTSWCADDSAYD